ncbi:MFS transporter [Timonella senegalensis]|uniref:MFS transporter n=1 Tax=Timonella senegalensis TaxID=1465825 RepID=UPI002FE2A544
MTSSDGQLATPVSALSPEQDARVRSARISLLLLFGLLGLSFSSWVGRYPSVTKALNLSTADLGVVLLAGAVGSLIFVTLAGPLVQRFGGRSILTVSAFGISLAFFLEGLGPTLGQTWILALGIFLNGVFVALTNVPQNVETAGVERRVGRSIISHFHAAYSVGAVAGSLIGALCAALDVSLLAQLTTTAVITLVVRLVLIPKIILDTELTYEERWNRADAARRSRVRKAELKAGVLPAAEQPTVTDLFRARTRSAGSALGAWREPRTLFIGVIIFASSLWLSIAVVDGFGKTEAIGAVSLGVFLASMTVIRVSGPRLIDRLGRVDVLRYSALATIGGLLLFGLSPVVPLAILGVVLWGIGAALVVPLAISSASDDPMKAAARVSVVSAFGSIASLAAPPVLGFIAESIGARRALTLIAIFAVLMIVLSRNVAPLRQDQKMGHQKAAQMEGSAS